MLRIAFLTLLLVGCKTTPPAYDANPWELGEEVKPPKACIEARERDPRVNC